MSLAEIDSLIEQTRYNEALESLTALMQKNPDMFDVAQKRVSQIIRARKNFNDQARLLIDQMEASLNSDADQDELDSHKMQVITTMEKSEKERGNESVELTNDARRSIALQYYINRENAILSQTSALIAKGEQDSSVYAQGAEISREGLMLKTSSSDVVFNGDEEIPVVYNPSIVRIVDSAIASISNEVDRLPSLIKKCQTSYEKLRTQIQERNFEGAKTAFTSFQENLGELSKCRNKIYAQGEVLSENDKKALNSQPGLGTTYIAFAVLSTFGSSENPDTGIIGSVDAFINTRIESLKDQTYQSLRSSTTFISSHFPQNAPFSQQDYSSLYETAKSATGFAGLAKSIHGLYALVDHSPVTGFKEYPSSMDFASYYFATLLPDSLSLSQSIVKTDSETSVLEDETAVLSSEKLLSLISFYDRIQKDCAQTASKASSSAAPVSSASVRSIQLPGLSVSNLGADWSGETAFLSFLLNAMQNHSQQKNGNNWSRLALLYAQEAESDSQDYSQRYDEAYAISGVDETASSPGSSDTSSVEQALALSPSFYPSRAIASLTELNTRIGQAKQRYEGYHTTLEKGRSYEKSEKDYQDGKRRLEAVIASLDSYTLKNRELIARATVRANQAKVASQEAQSLYNRALQNFKNNQFDQARDNLARSRTRYTDSFVFEENEALRTESDQKLTALDAQIADAYQRVVVAQTRELKTTAWNAYYNGDFETAEKNLIRARDLWSITNGDNEDQETSDLLAMVNTALSMKTGRIIPVTAPLYPEMSQILNISHQYYAQGASLMQEGKKSEAKKVLNQAKEKLRTLQLVYPLNQEASLLNLRIDNLIDPESFKKSFAKKVEDAKKSKNRQEAYATLSDLREINPSYPGLSDLILNLEYETGIRARPIQNTAKTQAKNLVAQARKIYNSAKGNESELDKAVALLDKAISLNPQETSAASLKDTIQIERGARERGILSAADEAVYLVAIQELSKNNVVNANAMVEQLMQKGNNRQVKKLQDLNRRIKAML